MAGLFVVTGKKGAVCRAGVELDSERLVDVPKGETVYVVEASSSACGVARLHVAFPVDGWVSAKVVGRWSSQAKRTKHGRDGGGLGFTVGEPAALSKIAAERTHSNARPTTVCRASSRSVSISL